MKFKKYSKIRHFIRDKILLPIANKLIGIEQHKLRCFKDGIVYEARYRRFRYWWDSEPITIKGILEKRKSYHVDYWDGGENGKCFCEMFGWGKSIIHVKRTDDIEELVAMELDKVIHMWNKYVTHRAEEVK